MLQLKDWINKNDVIFYNNKVYVDGVLSMPTAVRSDQPVKFTADQAKIFNDLTVVQDGIALVKTASSKTKVPGEILENWQPTEPNEAEADLLDFDLAWTSTFEVSSKELFITQDYIATPSTYGITYCKSSNKFSFVCDSSFVALAKQLQNQFRLYRYNESLFVKSKEISMLFPRINSETPIDAVEEVIDSSETVGKIEIEQEVLNEIKALPAKDATAEFKENNVYINSSSVEYQGRIKAKGKYEANVLVSLLDARRTSFYVCTNAIKYNLNENLHRIIPMSGS